MAVALLVLAGLLAFAAWLRPATAQDGTPASPMGTPATMGTADCAEVLGIGLPGDSCIRVIHASPDAEAVAAFVDEQNVVTSLAFGKATAGFFPVLSGEHRIRVALAADGIAGAVIDETVNLDPLSAGTARLRVVQAVPDAPPADLAAVGGEILIPDVTFGQATDYVEVPASETPANLEVRADGLPASLPLPPVTVQAGLVYSVYPVGQISQPWTIAVLVVAAPASGLGAGTPVPGPATVNLNLASPPAGTPAP